VTARQYDLRRWGKGQGLAQHANQAAKILKDMLFASMQVLTTEVLSTYKQLLFKPHAELIAMARQMSAENQPTVLLSILPVFEVSMEFTKRLGPAHTVLVKGWQTLKQGATRFYIWDPNDPLNDQRYLDATAQGGFRYQSSIEYRSDNEPDVWYGDEPRRLAKMKLVPLPASLFFPAQPRPIFNWDIIFS
jgi:hypothetical protein